MKRRVADDLEWVARYGYERGRPDLAPEEPGPKVKRRAKRRINRLERREAKQQVRDDD